MTPFILENPVYEINYLILPLIFLIGAIGGSFSHAFADGFINEKTLFRRSQCNKCKEIIIWYHLIPVVNFLYLKGKCFFCNVKIKIDLFLFEVFFGFLFVAYSIKFDFWNTVIFSLSSIFLGSIFETDRKKFIIYFPSLLIILILSVLFNLIFYKNFNLIIEKCFIFAFSWLLIYFISYAYFLLRGVQGFGSGDKWLLAVISTLFTFYDVIFIFFLSCFIGSIYGIAKLKYVKENKNIKIPFGSFMCFVTFLYPLI